MLLKALRFEILLLGALFRAHEGDRGWLAGGCFGPHGGEIQASLAGLRLPQLSIPPGHDASADGGEFYRRQMLAPQLAPEATKGAVHPMAGDARRQQTSSLFEEEEVVKGEPEGAPGTPLRLEQTIAHEGPYLGGGEPQKAGQLLG